MNHIRIVPWRSNEELDQLKDLFYSDSDEDKWKAVNKVKAYLIRGKVLHSIESTCVFTLAILTDEQFQKNHIDPTQLRSAYSMALIKFVNGLLDPYQKSTHAIPLHNIARMINLPSAFVEIRHIATHESLPGIDILRILAKDALIWLKEHFWDKNNLSENQCDKTVLRNNSSSNLALKARPKPVPDVESAKFKGTLKNHLRVYRRFHRNGLREVNVNSRNIKDEETLNYVKNLKAITDFLRMESTSKNYYSINSLIDILLYVLTFKNVLIVTKNDIKFNQLKILYTPLLEYLNATIANHILLDDNTRRFSDILLEYLTKKLFEYSKKSETEGSENNSHHEDEFQSSFQIEVALKWIIFLLFPVRSKKIEVPITKVLEILRLYPENRKYNTQILLNIKKKLDNPEKLNDISKNDYLLNQVNKALESLNESKPIMEMPAKRRLSINESYNHHKNNNDDEIFDDDLALLRKRLKVASAMEPFEANNKSSSYVENSGFLWEPVESYKPTPFGVTL